MRTTTKQTNIYHTFDGRVFTDLEEAKDYEAALMDRYIDYITLRQVIQYMRENADNAGLSYVTRICARIDGHEALI